MSVVVDATPEQVAAWVTWLRYRPENVRIVAAKLSPWRLYRIHPSGHRATIRGFDEHDDGSVTCRVFVGAKFNLVAFERTVYGVRPEDLEECEPPTPDEPLGSADMNAEDCREILDYETSLSDEQLARLAVMVERRRHLPLGAAKIYGDRDCYLSFGQTTVGPGETVSPSVETTLPLVVEHVLMGSGDDGLTKLSVVELYSDELSLFVSRGPFPASIFGEHGRGPTFGATVTKTCEKLRLVVANTSNEVVKFGAAAVGRAFETNEAATEYIVKKGERPR